jgi:hypothetical protein
MIEKIIEYLKVSSPTNNAVPTETLWKLCKELYDKGEDKSALVKKAKRYWEGKLEKSIASNSYFGEQTHTNDNVVQTIVETILCNMLDAQFSLAVKPDIGSFYDYTAIKEAHAIADIFNDEVKNIFKRNRIDEIKEKVGRQGFLAGVSGTKTTWNDKLRSIGDVCIEFIDAENIRWTKGASSVKECTMIAAKERKSVSEVKALFAKNPDGTYNEDLCNKIDSISEIIAGSQDRKNSNSVINYTNDSNSTAGRAYAEGTVNGIQEGKVVELICMYLLDDSVYAPEDKDDISRETLKQEGIKAYPNGRIIIFSTNDKNKLILRDEPASEEFKNLGNIDLFNPIYWDGLCGNSLVERLMPIQNRIDGLYTKYREKVTWDFDTLMVDDDFGMEDNAVVKGAITRVKDLRKYAKTPDPISNNGIEKAATILEMIEQLKTKAYQMARINETMLYGARQTGTTSGEQVEMLQESPMAGIRAYQQNFIDWLIGVGEKCLLYIAQNYTEQRIIELSTGMEGATIARINTNQTGQPMDVQGQQIQPEERYIELLNEVMQTVKVIKYNPAWKFKVEVIAGTQVPRSRREQAVLADVLLDKGMLGDINDPDTVEIYTQMQDIPNGRDIVTRMKRNQQKDANKPIYQDMLSNPDMMKSIGQFIKDLEGFTEARSTILQQLGLPVNPDTLAVAPVQEVMRQVDPHHLMQVVPKAISPDPEEQAKGQAVSQVELLNDSAKSAATLMREENKNGSGIGQDAGQVAI